MTRLIKLKKSQHDHDFVCGGLRNEMRSLDIITFHKEYLSFLIFFSFHLYIYILIFFGWGYFQTCMKATPEEEISTQENQLMAISSSSNVDILSINVYRSTLVIEEEEIPIPPSCWVEIPSSGVAFMQVQKQPQTKT